MTSPTVHDNHLLFAILIGAVAGVACGWFFGDAMLNVEWLGNFFLDALKMTIVPLLVAAVITGVTALGDIRKLGRVGLMTLLYYASTTALAVLLGLLLVNLIHPGSSFDGTHLSIPENIAAQKAIGFTDIIRSLITPNIVTAAAETNLLPIIIFCLIFGAAVTTTGDKGEPVISFFQGLNTVMMKIVMWIMYFAPVGVFAIIAARLGQAGGGAFWHEIRTVGWYIVTVISGLVIHFFVLFAILRFLGGRGLEYLTTMLRALLTAFGTASSSATLPLTMNCAQEAGVDPRAIKFVIPLGATVNMDGTALYEAVAAMFIAQVYAVSMGFDHQMIIFITATLASIGAAGIPQAGLVTMVIVLTAVHLPLEGVGLLLAVDWFLDRIRTTVNVWGDSVGAAVIEHHLPDEKQYPHPPIS